MTTENPTSPPASKSGLLVASGRALRRFPGVLAVAALGTALVIQATFQSGDDPVKWAHWRLLLVAALGISWLYSLSLIAERRWRGAAGPLLAPGLGFATLTLYYLRLRFLNEAAIGEAFLFEYLGLFFALHAFAAYAPYLGKREPRGFWEYNRKIFLRILAALLFSGTLYVGTLLFFVALSRILELPVLGYILVVCAASIVGIFNTWFFLAGVPEDFESLERRPPPYPRGLKAFAQFVLLPLTVAIGLVLELWLIQRLATGRAVDAASAVYFPSAAIHFLEGGRSRADCPQGSQESPLCALLPKEGRKLELYLEGRPLGKIDLEPIYGPLLKTRYETSSPAERESPIFRLKPEEMTFDRILPGGKARLRFEQIRLEKRGTQVFPDYVRFSLLFQKGS